jgi:hypothetical protein
MNPIKAKSRIVQDLRPLLIYDMLEGPGYSITRDNLDKFLAFIEIENYLWNVSI